MRKFNCNCFGEGAITNNRHTVHIIVWHDKDNPSEESDIFYIDAVTCPKCGTPTTIYSNNDEE